MAKRKVGRPRRFEAPEELENKIQEYFDWAKENNKHITITGLAWYLDIDRHTLLNYENSLETEWLKELDDKVKVEFITTIKRAKKRIEMEYEEGLYNKNSVVGTIFTLKNNYGWVDKQEITHENKEIKVELTD